MLTDAATLTREVQQIFAQVTRYPLDVLEPEAALEEELGIDSVKFGEVFAVLQRTYDLPALDALPADRLRTIGGITGALADHLHAKVAPRATERAASALAPPAFAPTPSHVESPSRVEQLLAIFAEVTRYPLDVLDPAADLEEELGIDSVKLGEVWTAVRRRYDLAPDLQLAREDLRTIAGIAASLDGLLARSSINSGRAPEASVSEPPLAQAAQAARSRDLPFLGKVALVTGSGRGLGKEIVRHLAELGATVIVNSFHSRLDGEATAAEIVASGGQALHLWGSVANAEQLAGIFREIEARCGGLDFFVSNASNGLLARLEDIGPEHWEKAFRTNVVGLHQGALHAARLMRRRGGGKILTMSSPAAHGYVEYFGCMGAVKAAVESLTRSLAIELAPDGIQVNCISPGPVYGDLLDKWPDKERLIPQWEANTARGRLCEASDVAHFVAYLLSDPVQRFTGSVLVMDGGISSQGW